MCSEWSISAVSDILASHYPAVIWRLVLSDDDEANAMMSHMSSGHKPNSFKCLRLIATVAYRARSAVSANHLMQRHAVDGNARHGMRINYVKRNLLREM